MTARNLEGESGGSSPLDESGFEDLRRRLDELRGSVERLGTEEEPPPALPPAPAAPAYEPRQDLGYPLTPPPADRYAAPPSAHPYVPAPPHGSGYEAEAAFEQPGVRLQAPATASGRTEEASAPAADSASIATLDAGPFSDLVELRRFEEALAGLGFVRDVRVRRFGHRRARIEVGMAGAHALTRELQRIGLPMSIDLGPGGEVVVQLPDPEAAGDR